MRTSDSEAILRWIQKRQRYDWQTKYIRLLAGTLDGKKSWMLLDIDLTDAVPTEKLFTTAEYREENLPRLRAKLSILKRAFSCLSGTAQYSGIVQKDRASEGSVRLKNQFYSCFHAPTYYSDIKEASILDT